MLLSQNAENNTSVRRSGARRPGPTAPNGEVIGDLWYDTSTLTLKVWNGTVWSPVGGDDSGWVPINSFANGWSYYNGAYGNNVYAFSAWRKKTGVVYLRGLIAGGTVGFGVVMFTLPVGFRPSSGAVKLFAVQSNNALARVDMHGDGAVKAEAGISNLYVSLDGISFLADG